MIAVELCRFAVGITCISASLPTGAQVRYQLAQNRPVNFAEELPSIKSFGLLSSFTRRFRFPK
jgi:hypothetical protein